MDTSEIRKKVHEIVDESNDAIIYAVYAMLKAYNIETETGTSIEQYNKELEEADNAISKGEFISQEDLEKEIKK